MPQDKTKRREERIERLLQARSPESEILLDDDYGTLSFDKGVDEAGNPFENFELEVKSFEEGFEERRKGVGSGIKGVIGMHLQTYTVHNPLLKWSLDQAESAVKLYMAIPKTKEEYRKMYPREYNIMALSLDEEIIDRKFGIIEELVLSKEQILKGVSKEEIEDLVYQRASELSQKDDKFGRVSVLHYPEYEDDEAIIIDAEYLMGKLHKVQLHVGSIRKEGMAESDKHYDCDTNPRTFEMLTEGFKKGLKKKLFERSYHVLVDFDCA